VTDRERVLRFVGRARGRMEAARLLRGAARGALAGGAAGLALSLAMKALPGIPSTAALPWGVLAFGAVAGAAATAARGALPSAAAALWLDARLGTRERFATVATRPADAFTDHVARELGDAGALPRVGWPREAALLPAAAFLLFAAGLLPEARPARAATPVPAPLPALPASGAAPRDAAALDRLVARLAEGETPDGAAVAILRDEIERAVARPEDRRAALEALDRAAGGDAGAAKEAARALDARMGGAGTQDGASPSPGVAPAGDGGLGAVAVYPDARELLGEYRRALASEGGR